MSEDDGVVMDLGGVYERCKHLARRAVMDSPRSSFSLEDAMVAGIAPGVEDSAR